jgi:hypothetical protein
VNKGTTPSTFATEAEYKLLGLMYEQLCSFYRGGMHMEDDGFWDFVTAVLLEQRTFAITHENIGAGVRSWRWLKYRLCQADRLVRHEAIVKQINTDDIAKHEAAVAAAAKKRKGKKGESPPPPPTSYDDDDFEFAAEYLLPYQPKSAGSTWSIAQPVALKGEQAECPFEGAVLVEMIVGWEKIDGVKTPMTIFVNPANTDAAYQYARYTSEWIALTRADRIKDRDRLRIGKTNQHVIDEWWRLHATPFAPPMRTQWWHDVNVGYHDFKKSREQARLLHAPVERYFNPATTVVRLAALSSAEPLADSLNIVLDSLHLSQSRLAYGSVASPILKACSEHRDSYAVRVVNSALNTSGLIAAPSAAVSSAAPVAGDAHVQTWQKYYVDMEVRFDPDRLVADTNNPHPMPVPVRPAVGRPVGCKVVNADGVASTSDALDAIHVLTHGEPFVVKYEHETAELMDKYSSGERPKPVLVDNVIRVSCTSPTISTDGFNYHIAGKDSWQCIMHRLVWSICTVTEEMRRKALGDDYFPDPRNAAALALATVKWTDFVRVCCEEIAQRVTVHRESPLSRPDEPLPVGMLVPVRFVYHRDFTPVDLTKPNNYTTGRVRTMYGSRWNDDRLAVETRAAKRVTWCQMAMTESMFLNVLEKADLAYEDVVRQSFGSGSTPSGGLVAPTSANDAGREALKGEWIDFLMTGVRACRGSLTDAEREHLRSKVRPLLPIPGREITRVPSFQIITDSYLNKERDDSAPATALDIVDRFHGCQQKLRRFRHVMKAVNFDIAACAATAKPAV